VALSPCDEGLGGHGPSGRASAREAAVDEMALSMAWTGETVGTVDMSEAMTMTTASPHPMSDSDISPDENCRA
jgi:hypothetical protein